MKIKQNKIVKKLCSYALALGVMTSLIAPIKTYADTTPVVAAQQTPGGVANFSRGNASITIIGNQGQSLVGKSFNIYKLFNAQNSKNLESINYTFNPTYEPALKDVVGTKLSKQADQVTEYEVIDYIQSLNTNIVEGAHTQQTLEGSYSEYRNFVEELRNKIVELGIQGDVVTVNETKADNSITIGGLAFGYYVTDEITSVEGTHSAASLIMVNTANPDAQVNIKSDYPSVVKKILEDDNNVGWNDIADYEIGQTVPYKFTSNIPNMNGYDTYYYAWRDKMDPALTFKDGTVSIVISGTEGGQPKTYTLKADEFTVNTNPGNGDTFNAEVQDIKAIVDREFNNMNANNENIYGQTVELRYDATLNDNAALDTGRPGFENDVKLVFSNDPDRIGNGKKGETPWDTVVCFTFRINGIKQNNHGANLEGAKFRLYSDEACQNEVYVKQGQNGYIVINRDSVGGTDHTGGNAPQDAIEMVSDANGVFNIVGLDSGTYYLKEVQAPDGYRRLLDPIVITVEPTYQDDRNAYVKGDGATDKTLKTLTAKAIVKEFWAGILGTQDLDLTTNLDEGSANITVVNKVGSKLPVTGSFATVGLLTLGSGLMGYALINKKKTKAE
ncbi:isopeptide-forming domain-containing fimbrial protein [uncultured Clostridium sp.]|uniref:isopeptide-forming domain-containing fimbrial protein n=1 Tax=uncultured Clostridium sp. TaxID=59620 RepID=UPI0025FAF4B7|nr:isopeptide-forming domain-containing fimbrial protein [uncultured Clostridium sp.]